ncbi:DNA/RNA helicase, superfamily I [Halobacteroides halobius DSM 5150]|uniref:DNA 3'-5' helicase n=1 Tax=Halobacteroides halobius (strain ATCC 35273 / DSM 5150 / MD-1) TaxID=748449 RepID=L0K894_HALHC|nr:ATP-dependent helicase [Halobacteroides halobius]AGB41502.1 DNA/RNA helicase, superfamily I [Halobacteroides halobius DSM 5150]
MAEIDFSNLKLRPGQDEVVKYRSGYLAVPAVPGAGKTFTLAHLAADLITEGYIKSGKILIVTYMNAAVANFRTRINNFLEQRGFPKNRGFEVKTLHSLAVSILKEKSDLVLINDDFTVIDQRQKWQIIAELSTKWLQENKSNWKGIISNRKAEDRWKNKFPGLVQTWISHLKMRGIDRDKALKLRQRIASSSYLAWALELLLDYSQVLHQKGWVDFDDLLINTWRLLKSDAQFCQRLREKWTYVFEDEAQDSNLVQETILKLLAGADGNLVRVGDSNQAIMGTFTAADPDVFRSFCNQASVKKESILYSGRSSQDIIDLANYLVDWTRNQHPNQGCTTALEDQLIHPVGKEDNPTTEGHQVAAKLFETEAKEIDWIVNQAADQLDKYPNQAIGILVPNRYVGEDITKKLKQAELPVEEIGKLNQEQEYTIKSLLKAIDYLAEPQREDKIIALINEVFLFKFTTEEKQVINKLFSEYTLEEVIYPIGGELSATKLPDQLFDNRELYQEFNEATDKIKEWLDASVKLPPDELVLFIAESLKFTGELLALVQGIVLQIRDQLKINPDYKLVDIMGQLSDLERSFNQIADKFNKLNGFKPQPGVITVLTAHKSKGLEWDTVFVTSVVRDKYPVTLGDKFKGELNYLVSGKRNPKASVEAQLENIVGQGGSKNPNQEAKIRVAKERLRLLYVAITRAEKNLFLTSYQKREGYYTDWYEIKPNKVFIKLKEFLAEE